mgnify:CR=1 FL=1
MAYSLGTLTAYTEQNANELLTKAVFGSKTISMIAKQTGIKSSATINKLNTDAVFQAGGTCGFNSSGTTSITQRTITVGKIKVQEQLCPPDLEAYYTQKALDAGSNYDSIAYAKDYTDLKNRVINAQMETAVWQGDTSSGTNNLSYFDGLIKIIDAVTYVSTAGTSAAVANAVVGTGTVALTSGSTAITGTGTSFTTQLAAGDVISVGSTTVTVASVTNNTTAVATANAAASVSTATYTITPAAIIAGGSKYTTITISNALAICQQIFRFVPAQVIDAEDMTLFMGWDFFRSLVTNITNLNFFSYVTDSAMQNGELTIPGTTMKVQAVHGLDGTNRAYAAQRSNLVFGTDMADEYDKWSLKYDEINEVVKYSVKWKGGVQVAFPEQITQFKLAIA